MAILGSIGIILFSLLLRFANCQNEAQLNDCPAEVYDDAPLCPPLKNYIAIRANKTCKVTLAAATNTCPIQIYNHDKTIDNISDEPMGRQLGFNTQLGCMHGKGPTVIDKIPNQTGSCSLYRVPLCEDGRYEMVVTTIGGTDATKQNRCYQIRINNQTVNTVLYFNLLKAVKCPRTETLIKLYVGNRQTKLVIERTQSINLQKKALILEMCFGQCGNESTTLQISNVALNKVDGNDPAKPCKYQTPDCKHYGGSNAQYCWANACQYNLKETKCAPATISCETNKMICVCTHKFCDNLDYTNCTLDQPIFKNKLTCRRAKTYYVYHPKQHCYNEKGNENCEATVIYAVSMNGQTITGGDEINYIADDLSGFRDPLNAWEPASGLTRCPKIKGVSDENTRKVYSTTKILRPNKVTKPTYCVAYPVPICQTGEYMLTIKMQEAEWSFEQKCTEVRINNVPIMMHMDPVTLSGGKCSRADVVAMFIAQNETNANQVPNVSLHLKGHDEPIHFSGEEMELQICLGYGCKTSDNKPEISAFVLERLGNDTKTCKLNPSRKLN